MTREEMIRIKEERGYSLKQISDYSGVPVVTLQKIFSGKTVQPRTATLNAIERVLRTEESVIQGKAMQYHLDKLVQTDRVGEGAAVYGVEKKQGEYTLEDYYALPEEVRAELIDGVLYEMTAPRTVHQDIVSYIHMCFYEYIRKNHKPCKVFESPCDVQLCCDQRTMVEPDVLVVCEKEKIRGFGIYGAPDFVLEVLSKGTRKKDMSIKLAKYLEAGVKEFWIIDPEKERLITYNFMEDEFFPCIHVLEGSVPVAISGGELMIDLAPVAESIRELGSLE